jgi:hypothetical protein
LDVFDAAYTQQTGEIIKELDVSLAEKPRIMGSDNSDSGEQVHFPMKIRTI